MRASLLWIPRMRICVYCASSQECDPHYHAVAFELGALLAEAGCTLVYGGGSAGSMGAVANGALSKGGEVIGRVLQRLCGEIMRSFAYFRSLPGGGQVNRIVVTGGGDVEFDECDVLGGQIGGTAVPVGRGGWADHQREGAQFRGSVGVLGQRV